MKKHKRNSGITLVALVISIIVMLILAGVSLNATIGENGIINKANEAKRQYEIADIKERINIDVMNSYDDYGGINLDLLNKNLKSHFPGIEFERDGEYVDLEKDLQKGIEGDLEIGRGIIELPVNVRYNNVEVEIDGQVNEIKKICIQDNLEIMQKETETIIATVDEDIDGEIHWYVEDDNVVELDTITGKTVNVMAKGKIGDITKITVKVMSEGRLYIDECLVKITKNIIPEFWKKAKETNDNWYNYGNANVNKPKLLGKMIPIKFKESLEDKNLWANAITSDGSMFVWIPRYAYMITEGYHTNSGGKIEIAFIDENNNFLNKKDSEKCEYITDNPAEDGAGQTKWLVHPAFTAKPENGGWNKNLTGIWVGKFEATGEYNKETQNGVLSVMAGTSGLINMTVNEQYKFAMKGTFGETVNLNSHMAKNSEWGAISYLGSSIYGTNGSDVEKNSTDFTGGSNEIETIYVTNSCQSTTQNATGVYDLNGGNWERVASYVNYDKNQNLSLYGGIERGDFYGVDEIEQSTSTVYKTVYAASGTDRGASYELTSKMKGDAIYEVSNTFSSQKGCWYEASIFYPTVSGGYSLPFFARGGGKTSNYPGMFMLNSDSGLNYVDNTFRVILIP